MTHRPGNATFFGPAVIAIHDDSNVLGDSPCSAGRKVHFAINSLSDFHQVGFFNTKSRIHFGDERISELLNLILPSTLLVL